ncbi:Wzz/FepE/Etk N-terminal domain-containing protein [Pseudidiomarina salilacus]|uniref:Wzz/FepE/Etk N-terminal domain-containing protein n=1 Tax=Pseudidiomarina salilacus TaxID=3384452 RepID=UPI0039854C72
MNQSSSHNDVIRLSVLFRTLWQRKLVVIIFATVFGVAAAVYSILEADVYRAEVMTIIPANKNSSGMPNIGGALGGLVGLGGLSMGDTARLRLEQVERLLVSRSFVQHLIEKYDMKADLLAGIGWDEDTDTMLYDDEYIDADGNWVIKEPSPWRVYGEFIRRVQFEILFNKNMLVIRVDHHSPARAQQWATSIIEELNLFYKERAEAEAQESIAYLEELMASTDFVFVREAISTLLEEQIKTDMLVEAREEYAFETLSPAVIPESKNHPKRLVITIIGIILGGILGVIVALLLGLRARLSA